MKISSSGKDPKGIVSMISQFRGEGSRVQKIATYGKSLGTILGCKAVGHSSLDKMHLGKSLTGTTKTVGKP